MTDTAKKNRLATAIAALTEDAFVQRRIIENATQGVYRLVSSSEDRLRSVAGELNDAIKMGHVSSFRIEKLTELLGKLTASVEEQRRVAASLATSFEQLTGEPMAPPISAEERAGKQQHAVEAATAMLAKVG